MENMDNLILALDASSSTVGISLFQDLGDKLELKLATHISPKISPIPKSKMELLFKKIDVFEEEFLSKYKHFPINHIIIEEALISANNLYTTEMLLKYNGMLAKTIYDRLGIVPEFISVHDSRKYGFPQLVSKRTHKKDGSPIPQKQIDKAEPVLFGAYPPTADKKMIVWELVAEMYPQINWIYNRKNRLAKESFDISDSIFCGISYFNQKKLGLIK
jgi:hypothetical protein